MQVRTKKIYADCILLIFNSYKSELSYGVDKENVVSTLTSYFDETKEEEAFSDDEWKGKTPREKSFDVINNLKIYGWLEFGEKKNFQYDVVLTRTQFRPSLTAPFCAAFYFIPELFSCYLIV